MKKITIEPRDEISQYQTELELLMDHLEVDPEIREAYLSDEAVIGDLFDSLATKSEIRDLLLALGLPPVDPSASLLRVLREMRRARVLQ